MVYNSITIKKNIIFKVATNIRPVRNSNSIANSSHLVQYITVFR